MSEEENKFDGIFMTVLQQKQSIGGFFESVYGFLRRSTDFFQDQKQAETVIVQECKKQYDRFVADKKKKEEEEKARKEKEEAKRRAKEQQQQTAQVPVQQPVQQPPQQQQVVKPEEQVAKIEEEKDQEGEKKDDEKPPVGNGGKTDKYIWTQTLQDVQIYIPIPEGIKSKQLEVQIKTDRFLIQIKGQEALINGEFYEKINSEESVWTITDGEIQDYKGRYIHVSLEKWTNQMHWWDCIVKGDPKINTQKINPEPSKLEELDGETRGTVEKMMFDMRQKQMGLPSSDELQKKNKLEDFMKAHPEMDFSKCKFN